MSLGLPFIIVQWINFTKWYDLVSTGEVGLSPNRWSNTKLSSYKIGFIQIFPSLNEEQIWNILINDILSYH